MTVISANKTRSFYKEHLLPFLRSFPYYLLLWPVFYAYNINNFYYGVVDAGSIWFQILKWQLLLIALYFSFRVFFSNPVQPAILTIWLAFLYFYIHPLANFLGRFPFTQPIAGYNYLVVIWILATIILVIYFFRTRNRPQKKLATLIMYIFIALTFFEGLKFALRLVRKDQQKFSVQYRPKNDIAPTVGSPGIRPDIYHLVFDSYTSTSCYREKFNYDNSLLDTLLKEEGFYIADSSTSNYFDSPVSLASVFNLNYIPRAEHAATEDELTYFCGLRNLDQNHLWEFLGSRGYRVYNYSNFNIKGHPRLLETEYFGSSDGDLLRSRTLQSVELPPLRHFFKKQYIPEFKDVRLEFSRSMLVDTAIIEKALQTIPGGNGQDPFLFYAHCLIPHPPYVIDSTGKLNDTVHLNGYNPGAFLQQSVHIRQTMIRWIRYIKEKSTRPFIILLQADHGYRYFDKSINSRHCFEILNAWYFQDKDYSRLYPTMSSVNTYRVVLNKYFGQQLPLLKDTSYFPTVYDFRR